MSALPAQNVPVRYLAIMSRRIGSVALVVAAVFVTALHAGLLWQRVADLSITEPQVMARWGGAALAASAALLLLRRRVSWRAWLVFALAIVLLHSVAAPRNVRVDVLAEAIFSLAPLILLLAGVGLALPPRDALRLDSRRIAPRVTLLAASLTSRAPPLR